jgi:hypothetical protein
VNTAELDWVKISAGGVAGLEGVTGVGVLKMSLTHSRTHRKPAMKSKTAVKIAALCAYRHSLLCMNDEHAIMIGPGSLLGIRSGSYFKI